MNWKTKLLNKMSEAPASIAFSDLERICNYYFGPPRHDGTSHHFYRTPWQGLPVVNIQPTKDGKAKKYQVLQALEAIQKLQKEENDD